jgi:hypothetical protein
VGLGWVAKIWKKRKTSRPLNKIKSRVKVD